MTIESVAVPPGRRVLAAAFAFRDVFVPESAGVLVAVPLEVSALGALAWRGDDGTYRISLSGPAPTVPAGTFPVSVSAPGGAYAALDPITVTLPRAVSSPPVRGDFLQIVPLWPTRRLRLPPGETAVHGVVTQLGVPQPGLRILLHPGAVPPPGTPEARTDERGEFVYRFPLGPGVAATAPMSLTVTCFDPIDPLTLTPSALTLAAGRVHTLSLQRP